MRIYYDKVKSKVSVTLTRNQELQYYFHTYQLPFSALPLVAPISAGTKDCISEIINLGNKIATV